MRAKTKTVGERIQEVRRIYEQLDALGLHEGVVEAIAEFRKIANEYVRNGVATTGAIPISSIRRILVYDFSTNPKVPCTVVMKAY